jgi:hypothetical protein
MQTYDELAEFACICARQAHFSSARDVAREFWRLALEYQQKAAAIDSGMPPDIGPPPAWFKE